MKDDASKTVYFLDFLVAHRDKIDISYFSSFKQVNIKLLYKWYDFELDIKIFIFIL